jgi:hypothetical protein
MKCTTPPKYHWRVRRRCEKCEETREVYLGAKCPPANDMTPWSLHNIENSAARRINPQPQSLDGEMLLVQTGKFMSSKCALCQGDLVLAWTIMHVYRVMVAMSARLTGN